MENKYLYIFVHIPKTAGSTLRRHLEKNFSAGERLLLAFNDLENNSNKTNLHEYQEETRKIIEALSEEKREEIKIIYGHDVPYGIHKYFKNKKPRYITFFRKPFSKTLSLYNFYLSRYEREPAYKKKKKFYQTRLLLKGEVPTFEVWLKEKYARPELTLKTTAQFLTDLGYLKQNPNRKDIKKMLEVFYFIGITERSKDDLYYIYKLLGIRKFFISQNISKKYVTQNDAKKYLTLMDEKNKSDKLIYKMAILTNKKFRKKNEEYEKAIKEIAYLRKFTIIYTQLRYDLKSFLVDVSQYLRRRSNIYSNTMDLIFRRDR